MTEQVKDQISALLDDELDVRECDLLLARLLRDDELKDTWERYSLIGDCIRGTLPGHKMRRVALRVAAHVQGSPVRPPAAAGRRAGIWRPLAGLTVAASVAVIAIVSLRSPESSLTPVGAPAAIIAEQDSYTVPMINLREQASASLRERLNLYQVSHSEFAGPMQRRSLLSQIASDDSLDIAPAPLAEEVVDSQ